MRNTIIIIIVSLLLPACDLVPAAQTFDETPVPDMGACETPDALAVRFAGDTPVIAACSDDSPEPMDCHWQADDDGVAIECSWSCPDGSRDVDGSAGAHGETLTLRSPCE